MSQITLARYDLLSDPQELVSMSERLLQGHLLWAICVPLSQRNYARFARSRADVRVVLCDDSLARPASG